MKNYILIILAFLFTIGILAYYIYTINPHLIESLYTLLIFALLIILISSLGERLLSILDLTLSSKEHFIFSYSLGQIILASIIYLLAALHLLHYWIIITTLIVLMLIGISGYRKWKNILSNINFSTSLHSFSLTKIIISSLLILCLLSILFNVLAPPTTKDELVYHLTVPKLYLEHNGFYFIEGNIYSNFPQAMESLFLLGLRLQGDSLARLFHYFNGLLIPFLICLFIKRYKLAVKLKKHWILLSSFLLWLSVPSVIQVMGCAYVDLSLTLYQLLALYSLLKWYETDKTKWLLLSAISCGFNCAIKYTGLQFTLILMLLLLWRAYNHRKQNIKVILKHITLFTSIVFIITLFWYAKSWILTGNPFYPFFYNIFGGKGWDSIRSANYLIHLENFGMGRSLLDYLLLIWNVSVNALPETMIFDGRIGMIFLFALPFILFVLWKSWRNKNFNLNLLAFYSFLYFIIFAINTQQIRFLIPLLPILIILIINTIDYLQKHKKIQIVFIMILVFSATLNIRFMLKDYAQKNSSLFVLGLEERSAYLNRNLDYYNMFSYINKNLPESSYVWLIWMRNLDYCLYRWPIK